MISQRTLGKTIAMASVLVVCLSSLSALGGTKTTGRLLVTGQVSVNGISAVPGISVLSRSRIRTGHDGVAVVSLGRKGRIEIGPDSDLVLQLSAGTIGGTLMAGRAVVSASPGTGISLAMAEATATTDGQQAALLVASFDGERPGIASAGGNARVALGSRVTTIKSGQQALLNSAAGQRSREISVTDAGDIFRAGASNRSAGDARLTDLLSSSVDQTRGTVTGDTSRPPTGRGLPSRGRQPDTRTPPTVRGTGRVQDVSRIIP
jgi:hypothetical protein